MKKYFNIEKTAEIGPDGIDYSRFGYNSYITNAGNRSPSQWLKMLKKERNFTDNERLNALKFKNAIKELRKLLT